MTELLQTVESVPVNMKTRRANWLRSPQGVWLRRALFQVHLWVGIALAVYAIAIGLSGSALVFRDEMEHAMWPAVYHVTPVKRSITMQAAVDRIQSARPGWVVFALRDFNTSGQATTALMRPVAGKFSANYGQVYFNPYTGEVLLDRLRYGGWLGWLANLHEYLLAGPVGLIVSGWMAVGLLMLCVTGIVLWWPGIQRWRSALMVNPRARWKRLNWELHSVVGFWACAALIVVTFTGLDFAFPDAIGNLVEVVTGGSLSTQDAQSIPQKRAPAFSNAPLMSIDQAIEAARVALPQDAPAGYLQLPATRTDAVQYKATGYYSGSPPYSELVRVTIDARTGAVLSYGDTRKETRGSRAEQYFTTIHFGSFGGDGLTGVVIKWLWVLVGVAPALLAVTGLIMYWNRKLRPAWLRMQRRRPSRA
jgi:uncharacterized iron-regulated membrane protein